MQKAILTFHCPDQIGIFNALTGVLQQHQCNIISVDQFSTSDEGGHFFLRLTFSYNDLDLSVLEEALTPFSNQFSGTLCLNCQQSRLKLGLLVSKEPHCLLEILHQWQSGDLNLDIPFILSNHASIQPLAETYGIPFHHIPASSDDRKESQILELVAQTDFLVLARYMQILSPDFLTAYGKDIINIHHSFLPSFKGASPYQQAFNRGVKVIGATAHFVTEALDEGPIIDQQVLPVTHRDDPESLKQKGKLLERTALLRAIQLYTDHRVFACGNKTVVLE